MGVLFLSVYNLHYIDRSDPTASGWSRPQTQHVVDYVATAGYWNVSTLRF